jgi:chromosome segregation ATPase
VPACDRQHVDTQNEEEADVEQEMIDAIAQMTPEQRRARLEELLNEVSA